MSDLVGNPEDRFSQNEAQMNYKDSEGVGTMVNGRNSVNSASDVYDVLGRCTDLTTHG